MSKYVKPTISLLSTGTASAVASTCSTDTEEANTIKEILWSMGYDANNAFGMYEDTCIEKVEFADYCKFSSSIQIFYS